MSGYPNEVLHFEGDCGSPETSILNNDNAEVMDLIRQVPERRTRIRTEEGGHMLNTSARQFCQESEQIHMGNVPSSSGALCGDSDSLQDCVRSSEEVHPRRVANERGDDNHSLHCNHNLRDANYAGDTVTTSSSTCSGSESPDGISHLFEGYHVSSEAVILNDDDHADDIEGVTLSTQEVFPRNTPNETSSDDPVSNPTLHQSEDVLDQESVVSNVNEEEALENGGTNVDDGYQEVDSISDPYYEQVSASLQSFLQDCSPTLHPKVISMIAEGMKIMAVQFLTRGSIKAGLTETAILRRLKTRAFVPTTIGLSSKGSAGSIQKQQEDCSICLHEYKRVDSIATDLFFCKHEFHAECLKEWLLQKNTCPMCRSVALVPEDFPDWIFDLRLRGAFSREC
ncbi:hypothetical protein ACH5RR_013955 [Cinchona calisaya]|uniref:RING-type E3 ubiquitin transferase n=1 Tax=Cinchona calisaya TaxID=153742 RepID=A0ABD3A234_9GENT